MMRRPLVRDEHGMTLVEMLIAMTVFLIVLAGAMSAIGAQSRGFNKGTEEMGLLQNLRYGVQMMDQEIRLAGANTPDGQAPVLYASIEVFSFNADVVSNLVGDISAVYIDPSAPAGQVSALPPAQAMVIPGSSPAFTWPLADFGASPAETITYRFAPNAETPRNDDFVLLRQVNNQPAEVLVRNVLQPAGGGPFFSYRALNTPSSGVATLVPVPAGWLPLRHTAPIHGQLPDTGAVARIDELRVVEVNYRVTNGRTGPDERTRAIRTSIPLLNAGIKKLVSCGDTPIFGQTVTATAVDVGGVPRVDVAWAGATDEIAGEMDVIRYVIWRRGLGVADWGDPLASLPSGSAPYLFIDADVAAGQQYQYAVAAQDCTPSLSPRATSNLVTIP